MFFQLDLCFHGLVKLFVCAQVEQFGLDNDARIIDCWAAGAREDLVLGGQQVVLRTIQRYVDGFTFFEG